VCNRLFGKKGKLLQQNDITKELPLKMSGNFVVALENSQSDLGRESADEVYPSPYFFAHKTLKRALRQVSPLSLKLAARTGS
jgi:hypothetical protein